MVVKAKRILVKQNEKIVECSDVLQVDVEKDFIILKIENSVFPKINIGSSKILSIGEKIYAIGSPLGFENTITEGIVSGLRSFDNRTRNFIQISAGLSHGSSGGAVVNAKGELIGISTYVAKEGQNIGFAIPIEEIMMGEKQIQNQVVEKNILIASVLII